WFYAKLSSFLVKFCKHWVEVRNNPCFWGFGGDRTYARVVRNRVFSDNTRYKWQKPQKPGFFDFDA
ncbi:hypothetical protein QUA35_01480, partial [Microcoleus sp. N9_B2]|uniref:hypothetical protein n=1 Tax=Microcoleus sp. N9_B2 TaxID=3055385 RepID=UPI002FD19A9D